MGWLIILVIVSLAIDAWLVVDFAAKADKLSGRRATRLKRLLLVSSSLTIICFYLLVAAGPGPLRVFEIVLLSVFCKLCIVTLIAFLLLWATLLNSDAARADKRRR